MIDLFLHCHEQHPTRITFSLRVTNSSDGRLLFPFPALTNLTFTDATTGRQAEWFTSLMVSAQWAGFTLAPEEQREFQFAVRPRFAERSSAGAFSEGGDYARYCVELRVGTYSVAYSSTVDHDYFDCDSHWRFPQLEREAARQSATPWTGTARSNVLTITISS